LRAPLYENRSLETVWRSHKWMPYVSSTSTAWYVPSLSSLQMRFGLFFSIRRTIPNFNEIYCQQHSFIASKSCGAWVCACS
jgi:hypothetical protein